MSRNERIVGLLGMSHGAAASRLRKMVLFRQLTKYGDNVCVRCEKKIEDINELSIEHIKPWEGRSAELFWDLDNIAFSHMKCNMVHFHNHNNVSKRKVGPNGTSWCRKHKQFLPLSNFSKHKQTWNGIRKDCRECQKKYKDNLRYGKTDGTQCSMVGN